MQLANIGLTKLFLSRTQNQGNFASFFLNTWLSISCLSGDLYNVYPEPDGLVNLGVENVKIKVCVGLNLKPSDNKNQEQCAWLLGPTPI